ncbi:hypothetical protein RFI_07550 [Reticulomyxa filosa]|uniref:Uncharacterized protein n=1 Tax=Reticulomyxa filosa TaxID=46433 RepID=X6NU81_RETFI|nr:hypothetical protein RFI_07550 [Reticulomyxa filosa]|eukprot:ETO29571.1 hypothetical protein RFI_07550 [Reticulomyxa filosa]
MQIGTDDADFENYYNTPQFGNEDGNNENNDDGDGNGNDDEETNYDEFVGLRYNFGYSIPISPKCDECCICQRTLALTWHHLIPRTTHSKMIRLHGYDQDHLNKRGIHLYHASSSFSTFFVIIVNNNNNNNNNKVSGFAEHAILQCMASESYNKLDDLLKTDKVQKWIKYIQKKKLTAHSNDSRTIKSNRVVQLEKLEKKKDKAGNRSQELTKPKFV